MNFFVRNNIIWNVVMENKFFSKSIYGSVRKSKADKKITKNK